MWQLQLPQQLRQRSLGWLPVNCGCLAHDSCQLLPTPVKLPSAAAITHRQPTDSKHFVPQYIAFDGRIGIDRMAADISCLKSQSISLECTVRNVKRGKMLPSANMCLAIIWPFYCKNIWPRILMLHYFQAASVIYCNCSYWTTHIFFLLFQLKLTSRRKFLPHSWNFPSVTHDWIKVSSHKNLLILEMVMY